MHYVYWLHRYKRKKWRLQKPSSSGVAMSKMAELLDKIEEIADRIIMRKLMSTIQERKETISGGFKDYIGVVVGIDPKTLMELKKKAGVQDNEQAILKAVRHYLSCNFDIEED